MYKDDLKEFNKEVVDKYYFDTVVPKDVIEAAYLVHLDRISKLNDAQAEFNKNKLEQAGLYEEFGVYGCDAIEHMADTIVYLRKRLRKALGIQEDDLKFLKE